MPLPIICLDAELRHFAEEFRSELSLPQWQHFVTVLLGLMLCEGASTLLGMLRQVADGASEAQLESISVLGAVGGRLRERALLRALPKADAGPGGSRTRAATTSASQGSRSPEGSGGDRVSDRG